MPRQALIAAIDFFYPPFRRLMPLQTFRYAACGGGNTVLGLTIYVVVHEYVLKAQNLDLGFFAFKPHIAALLIAFCINFVTGFILMKYVVFTDSNLRGRIQLFRYFLSFFVNLVLNYFLLKCFVEWWHWHAVLSQLLTTAIVVCVSYLSQKHFTFRSQG
jgi:putative flippase GtrA